MNKKLAIRLAAVLLLQIVCACLLPGTGLLTGKLLPEFGKEYTADVYSLYEPFIGGDTIPRIQFEATVDRSAIPGGCVSLSDGSSDDRNYINGYGDRMTDSYWFYGAYALDGADAERIFSQLFPDLTEDADFEMGKAFLMEHDVKIRFRLFRTRTELLGMTVDGVDIEDYF